MMNGSSFISEIYVFGTVLIFLGLAVMSRRHPRGLFGTALALAALSVVASLSAMTARETLFAGTYRIDLFSQVFKVLFCLGLLLVVYLCRRLEGIPARRHAEFYLLLFACTLALMLLVSSVHLLNFYVALELSSYALYALVALRRNTKMGMEAGIKYFLIGVCASAVMLFGIALLYGSTRQMHLDALAPMLPDAFRQPLVLIGFLLILGGAFFKLAVFPFHVWAPDVYQGAADQVVAYIATVSKVAAIAVLLRLVSVGGGQSATLAHVLVILAVLSMTVGNLAAIVQTDFKRLMAFSSVAHAGYILIGLLSMTGTGYSAVVFYALAVLLMKFGCFLVLVKAGGGQGNLEIAQLAELHRRSPLLALVLMLSLFGLAGIPPTIGFTGKLLVFTSAIEQGYLWLVIFAMVNVVISLYYYLMVIKAAYLTAPPAPLPGLQVGLIDKALSVALIVVMIAIGIYPTLILNLASNAARQLM